MSTFYEIITSIAILVVIIEVIAVIIASRALVKRKDAQYRMLYVDHLRRKHRVEDRLEGVRESRKRVENGSKRKGN